MGVATCVTVRYGTGMAVVRGQTQRYVNAGSSLVRIIRDIDISNHYLTYNLPITILICHLWHYSNTKIACPIIVNNIAIIIIKTFNILKLRHVHCLHLVQLYVLSLFFLLCHVLTNRTISLISCMQSFCIFFPKRMFPAPKTTGNKQQTLHCRSRKLQKFHNLFF